jgi:peptide-methionine (S)-S-oxide reductase
MELSTELAFFGGGCFWCLDAVFREIRGVHAATCGYMGGLQENPDYRSVCTGQTGHAEVVRVEFDPALVNFGELLEVFFVIHDPTQLNRQGNDIGSQYRSVIFWASESQRDAALRVFDTLRAAGVAPLVTALEPMVPSLVPFYPAEAEHQDYFRHHPQQGYCAAVVAPKLYKFREKFVNLLRK